MKALLIAVALLLPACTSGLGAGEVLDEADNAQLLVLKDTLTNGARAEATYLVEEGVYTFDVNALDLDVPDGVAIAITQQTNQDYCMTGTHEELEGVIWHVSTEETVPTEGQC